MNATTLRDRIRSRIAGRKALRASPRAAGLSEEQTTRLYDERTGSSGVEAARRELALLKRFRRRRRREP